VRAPRGSRSATRCSGIGAIPIAYGEDFIERVGALAPQGVDASVDGVGGEALDATLELVKDRSRILSLTDHRKAPELGIRVTPPARSAARLAELANLYDQGKLTLLTMATYPLSKAAEALRAYQAGNIRGKIVITIP
jgi:NADPH:quinone reductase-like Zn-dependent oxidoreductase